MRAILIWGLVAALFAVTITMLIVPIAIIQSLNNAHISKFVPPSPTGPAALDDEDLADKAGYNASLLPALLARAQAGDRSAMYFYGDLFDPNDFGGETTVPKNAATANAWYRRAVALDDQGAERNLGINYYFSTGMPEDYKMAAALFERAVAKNDDFGDYYLGLMLQNGEGEPADLPRAVALEQASAAQGQALGEVQLGLMYYAGIGGAQNFAKAQAEWRLAAAQGNQDAVNFLKIDGAPILTPRDRPECGNFYNVLPSAALVIKAHDCLVASDHLSTHPLFGYMIQAVEDAGIKNLLTSPGGMAAAQRVAILNDYGGWSYQWLVSGGRTTYEMICHCLVYGPVATQADNTRAETILKLVVQLAPADADAWLNLGNVYASMLNPKFIGADANATWAGKQQLTRDALDAYTHYRALTTDPTHYVKDFLALNDTNAPAGNVCRFVRAFANEDRLDETFAFTSDVRGNPVDLFGNGTLYYVYMGMGSFQSRPSFGSFHNGPGRWQPYRFIAASTFRQHVDTSAWNYALQLNPGSVNFKPLWLFSVQPYFDDTRLIAYKNQYYLLAIDYFDSNSAVTATLPPYAASPAAAVEIIQPNHGVICRMSAHVSTHRLHYDDAVRQ